MTTKLRIYQLISEQMERSVADLTDETLLRGNELAMDSLDCVELVMSVEDEFDLIILDERSRASRRSARRSPTSSGGWRSERPGKSSYQSIKERGFKALLPAGND